jgi:hypothetical protein
VWLGLRLEAANHTALDSRNNSASVERSAFGPKPTWPASKKWGQLWLDFSYPSGASVTMNLGEADFGLPAGAPRTRSRDSKPSYRVWSKDD